MGAEDVHTLIKKIRNKKIGAAWAFPENLPPYSTATEEMCRETEADCGIMLPKSFRTFLKEYSNGNIYLYGVEPLVGVGSASKLCSLSKDYSSFQLLSLKDINAECYIAPCNETIKVTQLIPFTFANTTQLSRDHWAFICDKEYPNHEYPVGYVTQNAHCIVCVLENFEKWLQIFWEGNQCLDGPYQAVISLLFPDYMSLIDLLDANSKEELIAIYPRIVETNQETFTKYGVHQR